MTCRGPRGRSARTARCITTSGAPRFGFNWTGTGQEKIREGKAPPADNEVVLGAFLATTGGFKVGDDISLLTLEPKKTFKITGIYEYAGGRDSLGGELSVAFTEPVAQQLLLGKKDVFSGVTVTAAQGTSDDALRDAVAAKMGSGYDVKTGAVLAKEQADQINEGLKFFNYVLLGFAGIALFVGIFIILNTFSIIVAQRTRELALLRSMGASRGQVIGSVVLEALVIGLIASIVGLGAGIGIGALLAKIFSSVGGTNLQLAGIGVPSSAIISSFAVGMIVTVIAAVMPALRASRIAPVAAMREAATPDRPLTKITITGALVAAAGGTSLALRLQPGVAAADLRRHPGGVRRCRAADPDPVQADGVADRPPAVVVDAGPAGPPQLRAQPAPHRDHRGRADGRHLADHRRERGADVGDQVDREAGHPVSSRPT